jgi:hypothetical protein
MEIKGRAIPTDVYDTDGNLLKIDFFTDTGEFILQCVWDEMDEQTAENRAKLREWAFKWMANHGWEIKK